MFTRLEKVNEKNKVEFITLILNGDTLLKTWGIDKGRTLIIENTYSEQNTKKVKKSAETVAKEDFDRIVKRKKKEGFETVYFEEKGI